MKIPKWFLIVPFILEGCKSKPLSTPDEKVKTEDPYLWLEEVEGIKPIEFAKTENKKTLEHFKANPIFNLLENDIRQIILAKDRVPQVRLLNGELYNFWQDDIHVRGLWRKTSIESYRSNKTDWEIILDLDELSRKENENWVWKGSSALPPNYERCFVYLSRGGKDAVVVWKAAMLAMPTLNKAFYGVR